MGLGIHMIEAVLREHLNRPITGDVLMVGRQTTYLSPEALLRTVREHGISVNAEPRSIELDKSTIDRKQGYDSQLVSDSALFKLLGARSVKALDHSPYEGAEVIHDLRYPAPASLHGIADFLIDGSTLDNVFTPSIVLQNYASLLRPGGRMLLVNAFSPHSTAYVIMPPLWYVDYFVMNKFVDCKVYVLMFIEDKTVLDNVFWVDLNYLYEAKRSMGRFISPHEMVTIVFAEKSDASTTERLPIQQDYRSPEGWIEYQASLNIMRHHPRHHLVRSRSAMVFRPTVPGHPFIDREFGVRS